MKKCSSIDQNKWYLGVFRGFGYPKIRLNMVTKTQLPQFGLYHPILVLGLNFGLGAYQKFHIFGHYDAEYHLIL